MAEAKALARMNVPLPEAARVVLLQEEKFQVYYETLTHALQEHERVMAQVPMAAKVLLRPHMEDIEAKLKPGAYLLTWTSLNIDGYLHHLHMVCAPPLCWACAALIAALLEYVSTAAPSFSDQFFYRCLSLFCSCVH